MPFYSHTPTFTDLIPLSTAEKIHEDDYARNRIIYVFVDQVIDANKIFARHVSGYRVYKRKFSPLTTFQDLEKHAIQIRLYAIKCPSLRNNKKPDPFAQEAKQFLEEKILHQVVRIKLLKKEKGKNVAICSVETSKEAVCYCLCRKEKMDLSQELCKAGYAELNLSGAPVLESYQEFLNGKINQAKSKRLGIWSLDEKILSPEELKKKQKKQRSMRKLLSVKSLMDDENENKSKRDLNCSIHKSRRNLAENKSKRDLGSSSHHSRGGNKPTKPAAQVKDRRALLAGSKSVGQDVDDSNHKKDKSNHSATKTETKKLKKSTRNLGADTPNRKRAQSRSRSPTARTPRQRDMKRNPSRKNLNGASSHHTKAKKKKKMGDDSDDDSVASFADER